MYLLDTCTFIWMYSQPENLSKKVFQILNTQEEDLYLSIISPIEMAIKREIEKIDMNFDIKDIIQDIAINGYGIKILSIDLDDCNCLKKLPEIHKDPFDRILVCQAINRGLTILTPDKKISSYSVKVQW